MQEGQINAAFYDNKYKEGYGLVYPDGHIIRIHKLILEWELRLKPGNIFDFGCGTGAHLKYFAEQGFTPFGCDTSETAIAQCRKLMPDCAGWFFVTPPAKANLLSLVGGERFQVFLSNQVLYFLDDPGIREIVRQAYEMVKPGGAFVATMVSHESLYARHIVGHDGDFRVVDVKFPRLHERMCMNFKKPRELETLFKPFRKLHIGWYGSELREDEGPGIHLSYVGVKD